jgi:catechol 2,3-dioxygenase-like lactoylglutathione lyase family enzyme
LHARVNRNLPLKVTEAKLSSYAGLELFDRYLRRTDFGQICDSDGTVLLCLHEWGAHEHPPLMSPEHATPGNGLLLFFRVDDFDAALRRARTLVSRFEEEPHVNPSTGTNEFSLRDPDGYYVSISALSAA